MDWMSCSPMRLWREVSTAPVHQGSGASATTNTQATMPRKLSLSLLWRISAPKFESCTDKISRMRAFASACDLACIDSHRNIATNIKQNLAKPYSLGLPAQRRWLPSLVPGVANCLGTAATSTVGAGGVFRRASCAAATAMGGGWELSPAEFLDGDGDDGDDEKEGDAEGFSSDVDRASSKFRGRRRGAPVYAVACGRKTGIFYTWEEAELAVRGFSGAVYKKFSTERAARRFIESRTAPTVNGGGDPGSTAAAADSGGGLPAALKPQPPPEPIGPFYAVARGHQSGVFLSWPEAKAAVQGATGVAYKRFNTRAEAEQFLEQHRRAPQPQPSGHSGGAPEPTEAAEPGPTSGKPVKRPRGRPRKAGAAPGSVSDTTYMAAAAATAAAPASVFDGDRFSVVRNVSSGDGGGSGGGECQLTEETALGGAVQGVVIGIDVEKAAAAVASHAATATATAAGGLWRPVQAQAQERPMGLPSEVPDWAAEWQCGPAPTFYAVARGKQVGIFTSWADARAAVEGVSGAQFRRFKRLPEAYAFLALASSQQQEVGADQNSTTAAAGSPPGGISSAAAAAAISYPRGSHDVGSLCTVGSNDQGSGIDTDAGIDTSGSGGGGGGGGHAACCEIEEAVGLHGEEGAFSLQRAGVPKKEASEAKAEEAVTTTVTASASYGPSAMGMAETATVVGAAQKQQLEEEEGEEEEMLLVEDDGELLHFGGLTGEVDPSRTYRLEFDGGSRRNPGDAGFGALLVDVANGQHVDYVAGPLSSSSNNVAEWSALVAGMQMAIDMGVRHLIVQGDSELVCRQVNGRYGVNTPSLQPLADSVCSLRGRLDSFDVVHVPRSANAAADLLSNFAMDAEEVVAAVVSEDSTEPFAAAAELQARRRRRMRKQLREQLQPTIRELGEPALQAARAAIAAASAATASLSKAVREATDAPGIETTTSAPAPATGTGTGTVQCPGGGPGFAGRSQSRPERSSTPAARAGAGHGWRVEVLMTECRLPVAARGSVVGSMEDFKRVLIAIACASHGLLE